MLQANETVATDNGIRYWVYADLFYRNCQYPNWNAGCSQQQVEAAGLDWAMVAQCSSGAEVSDNTPNALLEEQITLRSDLFIVNLPSVVINGIIERGTISPRSVLQTICNGFSENVSAVKLGCFWQPLFGLLWLVYLLLAAPGRVPVQQRGVQLVGSLRRPRAQRRAA